MLPEVLAEKVQSFSYSRLKALVSCTLRALWDLQYQWLHGSAPPGSFAAIVGTLVHVGLEAAFHFLVKAKPTMDEATARIELVKIFKMATAEAQDHKAGEAAFKILCGFFDRMISPYQEFDTTGYAEYKVAIDRNWKKVPFDSDDAWFRMVLDRIWQKENGRGLVIRDYKSGLVDVDWTQIQIYSGVAFELRPELETIDMELTFVARSWTAKQTVTRKELVWVRPFLEAQIQKADGIVKLARQNDLSLMKPTVNRFCGSCAWIAKCPVTEEALKTFEGAREGALPMITSYEDAQQVLTFKTQLKKASDAYTEKLKLWVQDHGPVKMPNAESEYRLVEDNDWEGNSAALVGRFLIAAEAQGKTKREAMEGIWPALRMNVRDAVAIGAFFGIEEREIRLFGEQKPGQMFKVVAAPPAPPQTFGDLIRTIRGKRPAMELSRKMDEKPRWLGRVEAGELPPPDAAKIKVMAQVLGTDLESLLEMAKKQGGGDGEGKAEGASLDISGSGSGVPTERGESNGLEAPTGQVSPALGTPAPTAGGLTDATSGSSDSSDAADDLPFHVVQGTTADGGAGAGHDAQGSSREPGDEDSDEGPARARLSTVGDQSRGSGPSDSVRHDGAGAAAANQGGDGTSPTPAPVEATAKTPDGTGSAPAPPQQRSVADMLGPQGLPMPTATLHPSTGAIMSVPVQLVDRKEHAKVDQGLFNEAVAATKRVIERGEKSGFSEATVMVATAALVEAVQDRDYGRIIRLKGATMACIDLVLLLSKCEETWMRTAFADEIVLTARDRIRNADVIPMQGVLNDLKTADLAAKRFKEDPGAARKIANNVLDSEVRQALEAAFWGGSTTMGAGVAQTGAAGVLA